MLGILFRGRSLRSCFVERRRAVRSCLLGSGAGSGHPCLQEGRSDNASRCACCRHLGRVVRLGRMLSLLRGRRNKARFEENEALKDLFILLLKRVRLRSRACGPAQHGGGQSCPSPGSAEEEEEPCAADICSEIFLTHSLCGQLKYVRRPRPLQRRLRRRTAPGRRRGRSRATTKLWTTLAARRNASTWVKKIPTQQNFI